MTQPIIDISHLYKEYAGETETVRVLEDLEFSVEHDTIVSVEGASGEGKSTLLNIIGTIDSFSRGEVKIDGQNVSGMSQREKELFRATSLGFIFQHHYLLPDFTLLENVMMPLLIQRRNMAESGREAAAILGRVGLDHRLDHYPSQISGGEMARAGVARALVGGKRLILADEPTGNLDRANSDKLVALLWELQKEFHFTILIVTHDRDLASKVPKRYQLSGGKLKPLSV